MRIELLAPYKYFFQLIKEDRSQLKRFSLLLVLIPLLVVCYFYHWNPEIILFLTLAYLSATAGFLTAYTNNTRPSVSFAKQFYHHLIAENLREMVVLVSNRTRKILFANPAFYKGLGFPEEPIPTIHLEDFMNINKVPHFRRNQINLRRRKGSISILPISGGEEAVQIRKQNGDLISVAVSKKTVGEGGIYTLYQLTEVTEKVLRERATSQFAKDLLQRKSSLKALKRKEAEVILMMNLERTKLNS